MNLQNVLYISKASRSMEGAMRPKVAITCTYRHILLYNERNIKSAFLCMNVPASLMSPGGSKGSSWFVPSYHPE
jgi:hypothetical protein